MKTIHNENGGFTLIELLFVIVILVTLVTISAPQFSRSYQAFAQDRCLDDLLSLMDLAHERAIMEQTSYAIQFDSLNRGYRLEVQKKATEGLSFDVIAGTQGRLHPWPQEIDCQPTPALAIFHPDGTASSFSVIFLSKGQRLGIIDVDPVLGKGTIHERA